MALNVATLVARVIADTSGFNRGMGEAEGRMRATSAAMMDTGRTLTHAVTVPLLLTAGAAVKLGIDFQKEMTYIQTQAGLSAESVKNLSQQVLTLAPSTRFGPDELAKGLFHAASVTHNAAQSMTILKTAAQGAAVGGADLESTVSVLAGTLRVFHAPVSESAHYMGILNAIVGAGNMRMQDLNNAIATGLLPTARSLHLGLADVGSALAMMTDESTPAQVAANRMRTALLMMTGETKKSRSVLAELGIGSLQLGHDLHSSDGLVKALSDVRDHLKKIPDDVMKTRLVAELFGGSRSAGTVLTWLNNLDMIHSKFNQINQTASHFPAAVIATQATDSFKLHQAWAAIQTVLIQVGAIVTPIVIQIAQTVSRVAQAFGHLSPGMRALIVYGGLVAAAIGPILFIFGAMVSPIGLVVTGVFALAAAGIYLYNHFEGVRKLFDNIISSVRGFTDAIGLTTPVINRGTVGFTGMSTELRRFHQISGMLHTAWTAIAPSLSNAFHVVSNAAGVVATFVVQQFQNIVNGIKAHSAEIVAFLKAAWQTIEAVTKAVWPIIRQVIVTVWDAIKIVVRTALQVIGNIILTVMDLISGNWSGAWHAIERATGALLSGIVNLIGTLLSGAISIAWRIAKLIGSAIWDGIKTVFGFLASLPGRLIALILDACTKAAEAGLHAAEHIGSNIMHGIIGGIKGMAGGLLGTVKDAVMGPLNTLGGWLGVKSPSTYTRDHLGKPIAEGIIQGYLIGIAQLPAKMNQTVRAALEAARNVIQANQQRISDAWTRLSDYAMRAFDARTTQHLNQMQVKFDALIKSKITDPLKKAMDALDESHQGTLDAITAGQNAMTPAEAQLQGLQDAHAAAQRQDAIASARDALTAAQAGGDQSAIVQAQKDLANALYDEQIAGLQKQAAAERTQANIDAKAKTDEANEAYKKDQEAIQLRYDTLQKSLQKTYDQQVLNYQAERDLQKQHLQDLLTNLEKQLELHPQLWQRDHNRIMKLFRDAFGPGYKTAGTNLGLAFAEGLRESFGGVRAAASALAAEVAKYLKLHSPAEKGPLSDLHNWWKPMASTLASGIDHAAMARVTSGIVPPSAGGVGTSTRNDFDPKSIADALAEVLNRQDRPLIGEYHDNTGAGAESVATTLGRKLAIR